MHIECPNIVELYVDPPAIFVSRVLLRRGSALPCGKGKYSKNSLYDLQLRADFKFRPGHILLPYQSRLPSRGARLQCGPPAPSAGHPHGVGQGEPQSRVGRPAEFATRRFGSV